jgi:phage protein D
MPGTNQPQVPTFRVRINGADLSQEVAADLIAVTVHEDVDAPGMFTLRLINWDMDKLIVTWADDQRFAEGGKVELQMGYVDQLQTLIAGEITGLEPEFSADDVPTLTVRGYDRRHRLLRGRRTRSFTKIKDSDIARQIASALGLSAEVSDTGVTLEYVFQHNQTDMEFLQQRASQIGYEVAIKGETLLFRPRQHDKAEVLTLTRDADLIEFFPRLTTLSQVGKVAVRGWNPKEKAAIVAEAAAGSETTTMGGRTSGPRAANAAFGQTSAASVQHPVFSKAEADKIAQAQLNTAALAYIGGEGICIGRTDLRAGTVIKIAGLGKRFSGQYYVTSTQHSYTPERGYRTSFRVRRNAT